MVLGLPGREAQSQEIREWQPLPFIRNNPGWESGALPVIQHFSLGTHDGDTGISFTSLQSGAGYEASVTVLADDNKGDVVLAFEGSSGAIRFKDSLNDTDYGGISAAGWVAEQGVVALKETTTPTAVTDYGRLYTKTDNTLYFQDGAGTETAVSLSSHSHETKFLGLAARVSMGSWNTSSTSYVDYGGATSVVESTVTKVSGSGDTDLLITFHASGYQSAATSHRFAVDVGSTDYDIAQGYFNATSDHQSFAGSVLVTGLAAGSHTCTLRLKVTSGTFTTDSNDSAHLEIWEVPN